MSAAHIGNIGYKISQGMAAMNTRQDGLKGYVGTCLEHTLLMISVFGLK